MVRGTRVFLSCDSTDTFFRDAVKKAIKNVQTNYPDIPITYTYPPEDAGVEGEKIVSDTMTILLADIIIFNATPAVHSQGTPDEHNDYNPGVLIEYGIVLGQDEAPGTARWMSRHPKPVHKVFWRKGVAPRSSSTPLLSHEKLKPFEYSAEGEAELILKIEEIIRKRITQQVDYRIEPGSITALTSLIPFFLEREGSTKP